MPSKTNSFVETYKERIIINTLYVCKRDIKFLFGSASYVAAAAVRCQSHGSGTAAAAKER